MHAPAGSLDAAAIEVCTSKQPCGVLELIAARKGAPAVTTVQPAVSAIAPASSQP